MSTVGCVGWRACGAVLLLCLLLPAMEMATGGTGGVLATRTQHEKRKYSQDAQDSPSQDIPDKCPPLLQPTDIGFLVINLDRSVSRLARMRQQFDNLGLPQFERVPGVEYDPARSYPVARGSRHLKPADFGTAMAHYQAWKQAYPSNRRWNVIMEDDAELLPNVNLTGPWPKVPRDADLVLLRHSTMFKTSPVCKDTSVLKADWGFGMVAYLVNRAGAKRMMGEAERAGFRSPIDGHVWYHSKVYAMGEDWITHPPCKSPCPTSIRTYLNGEIDEEPD